MPGFAVFYRDPNSARVTFGQYIRVTTAPFIKQMLFSAKVILCLLRCFIISSHILNVVTEYVCCVGRFTGNGTPG